MRACEMNIFPIAITFINSLGPVARLGATKPSLAIIDFIEVLHVMRLYDMRIVPVLGTNIHQ